MESRRVSLYGRLNGSRLVPISPISRFWAVRSGVSDLEVVDSEAVDAEVVNPAAADSTEYEALNPEVILSWPIASQAVDCLLTASLVIACRAVGCYARRLTV